MTGSLWLIVTFAVALGFGTIWSQAGGNIQDQTKRIGCLDGLRGYLALGVLAHHFNVSWGYSATGQWTEGTDPILASLGASAVICFFMITGLLFYGRISQGKAQNWRRFFVGRVFRLAPMYFVTVLLVASIAIWMSGKPLELDADNFAALASWITFTSAYALPINDFTRTSYIVAGVTWTLRYEWVFYLSLPLLALVFSIKKTPRFWFPVIWSVVGIGLLLLPDFGIAGFTTHRVAPFFFGMLTVHLVEYENMRRILSSTIGTVLGLSALAATVIGKPEVFTLVPTVALFAFFATVVAGNSYFGLLRLPGSIVLGDASYSIYLLHGIALFLMIESPASIWDPQDTGNWVWMPLVGAAVTVASLVTHHVIEKSGISAGQKITSMTATKASNATI